MKISIAVLSLAVFCSTSCKPSEEVLHAARDAETTANFSQIIASIGYYEIEYDAPILASDSAELADVLEGENEKEICFYIFPEDGRNELGEILDAYGNPISVRNLDGQITLYSNGRNGIIDSSPTTDDIVQHYKSTKHNQSGDDNSE